MNERIMWETCVYCEGNGYFQVITGGSTTCLACEGEGLVSKRRSEESIGIK
ncbi:YuiA family protein [Aneurinibacillus aneurinilyticus]|uniref:YuiA family protein n=1 Tax=Aneurinibacillus aneurinilyticus TaxID=1391 RepID=UPI003524677C